MCTVGPKRSLEGVIFCKNPHVCVGEGFNGTFLASTTAQVIGTSGLNTLDGSMGQGVHVRQWMVGNWDHYGRCLDVGSDLDESRLSIDDENE